MLRRRFMTLALLLAGLTGLTWASDTPTDKTGATSRAQLFNPSISESRIAADIYYLTTEECEGRGSTTQGIHRAADYIVSRLKQAGLKPGGDDGYFQHFVFTRGGVRQGTDNRLGFQVDGTKIDFEKGDLQVLAAGNAGAGEGGLVFAGYGITSEDPAYDDYKDINAEGKVLVILRKTPRPDGDRTPNFKGKDTAGGLNAKITQAAKHKAAAVLFVNDTTSGDDDKLLAFNFLGTRAERGSPPAFHVKRDAVDRILKKAGMKSLTELEKGINEDFKPASQPVRDVTVSFKSDVSPIKIKNIIATVPGAGELADEIVVVGSHYDHVGRGETGSLAGSKEIHFGADDNGSGTVCNLDIARRWHDLNNGPNAIKNRRRVVFQWYAAEEWGLIGSQYYVDHPIFPIDRTVSMLNLDMVGRLGFDQFKVGPGQDAEEIKQRKYPLEVMGTTSAKEFPDLVNRANKDLGINLTLPTSSQYFGASDHYSFYRKDIPVMFFFTGMHPQYHRPTDTFQTVNIKGIRQCAELGQNVLEELATMKRPEFVKDASTTARRSGGGGNTARPAGIGLRPDYSDEKDGVLVDGVTPNRPAMKAGIKAGDRILEIDGKTVKDVKGYMELLGKAKNGDKLEVLIDRKGEKVKIMVTYEATPASTNSGNPKR